MNESDWQKSTEPEAMLGWLLQNQIASTHKLRCLFGACCDRIQKTRDEGIVSQPAPTGDADETDSGPIAAEGTLAGTYIVLAAIEALRCADARNTEKADLLRDIFGPLPFRDVDLDPRWRTDTVLRLAESAYEHRQLPQGTLEPERLGVLADALEEAGAGQGDRVQLCLNYRRGLAVAKCTGLRFSGSSPGPRRSP